jgi:hypothetical protein
VRHVSPPQYYKYYFLCLLFTPTVLIVFAFWSTPSVMIILLETTSIFLHEILKTISLNVSLLSQRERLAREDYRQGTLGSLNALLTRIKHKYRLGYIPLMRLLTICIDCSIELELYYEADQIDQIFCFRETYSWYRRRGSLPRFQSRVVRGKAAKFSRSRISLLSPVSRVLFVRGFVISNHEDNWWLYCNWSLGAAGVYCERLQN